MTWENKSKAFTKVFVIKHFKTEALQDCLRDKAVALLASLIVRTQIKVEEEKCPHKIVLWPPHAYRGTCAPILIPTYHIHIHIIFTIIII